MDDLHLQRDGKSQSDYKTNETWGNIKRLVSQEQDKVTAILITIISAKIVSV
jgi:hypothetical protein